MNLVDTAKNFVKTSSANKLIAVVVAVGLAVGAGIIIASRASGFFTSTEPDSGTLSGNVSLVADSSASNGKAVQFNAPAVPPPSSSVTKHYSANTNSNQSLAVSLGFNVVDIAASTSNPSNTKTNVDGLPSGVQALVWVGNLDNAPSGTCPAPGFTTAQFQAVVDALAGDSKVFGYFLSDEPHPAICPNAASDIRARADYIHAKDASQKAFIVILDGSNQCGTDLGCEYSALGPANTHVDLVGLDPYPCHYSGTTAVPCDNSKITSAFQIATSKGINASAIVPVFQTFGQEGRTDGKTVYYRTPTASELTAMLSTWAGLVPHPAMDYAYTFGVQCSSSCPAPQAIANHTELQTVVAAHNQ